MGNFLHRTTKAYLQSTSPGSLPEALANYISMPDMSAVEGVPSKYWVITGDTVSEMSQAEKDAVDEAVLSSQRDSAVETAIEDLEGNYRQLVKLMLKEINILRAKHNLADRTIAQFKTQIRNGYGA